MGASTAILCLMAVSIFSSLPDGDCFLSSILESVAKTSAHARNALADTGNAGLSSLYAGTKGLNSVVKFATDTIQDVHTNVLRSTEHGQKKAGELIEEGVDSALDVGKRVTNHVRNTAYTGSRKIAKNGVDFLKSGLDVLNRATSGTTSTGKVALKESVGKALKAMPDIPVIKPLLRLPYKVVKNRLDSLTTMSDEANERVKSILDKFRPESSDD